MVPVRQTAGKTETDATDRIASWEALLDRRGKPMRKGDTTLLDCAFGLEANIYAAGSAATAGARVTLVLASQFIAFYVEADSSTGYSTGPGSVGRVEAPRQSNPYDIVLARRFS
jgi:hypothetical protein